MSSISAIGSVLTAASTVAATPVPTPQAGTPANAVAPANPTALTPAQQLRIGVAAANTQTVESNAVAARLSINTANAQAFTLASLAAGGPTAPTVLPAATAPVGGAPPAALPVPASANPGVTPAFPNLSALGAPAGRVLTTGAATPATSPGPTTTASAVPTNVANQTGAQVLVASPGQPPSVATELAALMTAPLRLAPPGAFATEIAETVPAEIAPIKAVNQLA